MATIIVAMYDHRNQAEKAAGEPTQVGYDRGNVELVAHDEGEARPVGFWGNLFGSDTPREEAEHHAEGVRRGSSVVALTVEDDRVDEVEAVLDRYHPVDLDRRVQRWREGGYADYDREAPAYTAEEVRAERERYETPAVEENVKVGKREVERGGKRIRTYI